MDEIDALKGEFLTEAKEHIASAEKDILTIEQQGDSFDSELINNLFRSIHSIKGGSSFLELTTVTELSHTIENVIDSIRNGSLKPDGNIIEVTLGGIDKLKYLLFHPDEEVSIKSEVNSLKQLLSSPIIASSKEDANNKVKQEKSKIEKKEETEKKSLLTRALLKRRKQYGRGEIDETAVIRQEEIIRLMREGFHIYKISIDLVKECDKKNRDLINFFHNINVIGTIHSAQVDIASAGKLCEQSKDSLVYNFIFSTVIEDWDILSKGLDIAPLSITRLLSADSLKDEDETSVSRKEEEPVIKQTKQEEKVVEKTTREEPVEEQKKSHLTALKDRLEMHTSLVKTETQVSTIDKARKPEVNRKVAGGGASIRISLSLVDKLMDLVSELVLVRNQNIQSVDSADLNQIRTVAKKLNVVTSELQASIMQTRMQQLDLVFSRFTRLVRDLGKKLEKEVEIEIQGGHVELDKNIIEAIGDPLTHIVRNALDHGIESARERALLDKPIIGKIKLMAYHEAGHVNIKVSDDGRGIDPENLKRIAVKKGLLTPVQAQEMSIQDTYNLMFKPGFSTADTITDVSGRGVGMDVVKSNLEKFGAVINIYSNIGEGTTFEIKLPLTLAIISALIVRVSNLYFAIPQFNIAEIIWLYGDDVFQKIKTINTREVLSVRGRLIPAVRLAGILGMGSNGRIQGKTDENGKVPSLYAIILKLGNIRYSLIVDTIIDTKEIVVKPLHEQIKKCMVYSGTTVLGDGNIAIILDISNIGQLANVNLRQAEERKLEKRTLSDEEQSVIIFSTGGREIFSIPLFLIRHIEKLRADEVMTAHNREYYYYQEHIVPLIRLEQALEHISSHYLDDIFIIILKSRKPIGIIAAHILDTTTIKNAFDVDTVSKEGILGSVVKNNELILILDTFKLIEKVEPGWFKESAKIDDRIRKILVIEDTQFYSSIIRSYFKGSGIEVVLARNGKEGIDAITREKFDLVISDLEMPNMDGFEFAQYVKNRPGLKQIPLIALSGAFSEKEGREKAIEAGFDFFITKKNKDEMFDSLHNIMLLKRKE